MFPRRKTPYDEAALYEYAVGALARRGRAVAELKRLLRQRVAGQEGSEALVETVVRRLKEHHYLNDTEFAVAYAGFRRENERFGRRRVISDLKAKGVHSDIIEKTVNASYEGVDEEALAREHLRHKRLPRPADQRQAARVFRALTRAGFTTRTIIAILRKWSVDEEVLSALETEQNC
jgi:regulatory protein